MERIRVTGIARVKVYVPIWTDVEKDACFLISKNVWRMPAEYDYDTLYQEAWIIFDKISKRYKFDKPAHTRGMFKRCLMNKITDLAKKRTKQQSTAREISTSSFADHLQDMGDGGYGESQIMNELSLMDAGPEVRELIEKIDGAKPKYRHRSDGTKETTNQLLCRHINKNPNEVDLASSIRELVAI